MEYLGSLIHVSCIRARNSQGTAYINSPNTDVGQNESRSDTDLQENPRANENMSRPGAFAVAGIGGGRVAWESSYGDIVKDYKSVEEEPDFEANV